MQSIVEPNPFTVLNITVRFVKMFGIRKFPWVYFTSLNFMLGHQVFVLHSFLWDDRTMLLSTLRDIYEMIRSANATRRVIWVSGFADHSFDAMSRGFCLPLHARVRVFFGEGGGQCRCEFGIGSLHRPPKLSLSLMHMANSEPGLLPPPFPAMF